MAWQNNSWAALKGVDFDAIRRSFESLTQYLNGSSQYMMVPLLVGPYQWTNMPAAETEHIGTLRSYADLTLFESYQLGISMASAVGYAGSVIRIKYTTDLTGAGGWTTMDSAADVPIDGTTYRYSLGEVGVIPTSARTQVLIGVFGQGGDGVVDPMISSITAHFRPGVG